MSTLNDIDVGTPGALATLAEVAADVRALKEVLKNFLVVAHQNDGNIDGTAIVEVGVNSVDTGQLVEGAVTAVKLADASVTMDKLGTGQVIGSKLAAGLLVDTHFSDQCIPTRAFKPASMPTSALMAKLLTVNIEDLAVTTAKIADASVTDAKINSVGYGKLSAGTVDGQVLTYRATGWVPEVPSSLPSVGVALIRESAAAGGGEVTAPGLWNRRILGIASSDEVAFVSVADTTSELSFVNGTYFMLIRCPAKAVGTHMTRLMRKTVTGGAVEPVAYGSTSYNLVASDVQTDSVLFFAFTETASGTYTYYIEHYIELIDGASELGVAVAANLGINNIHTSGFVIKLG